MFVSGCYAAGVLPLVVAVGAIGLMFVQVMMMIKKTMMIMMHDNVCAVSSTDQAQGSSPQSGHEQRRVQIQVQEDILEDGKSLLLILDL